MADSRCIPEKHNQPMSINRDSNMKSEIVRLELPANHKYLNILGVCITALVERVQGLTDPKVTAYNLDLAAHEACTNIVRHAYADQPQGRIEAVITLEKTPARLTLDLYDTGKAFDATHTKKPNLDEPQVHGYGLFLMEELLDDIVYDTSIGKNHWRLVKNLR